jgi:hypothetical protein
MSRIRKCAGNSFFTGKSVCEIDYDKIKAVVLTKHGIKLDYSSLAELRTQCHADLPDRAYGLVTVINWEVSGGEVQTSQVGYGPNAYNGVSARTDTFTLDKFRHYLRASILANVEEDFDMYLIDVKNNLYGLNDGEDTLAGIPVNIYPSGNDHPGASDKESLAVNCVYQDVEAYMLNLDVVPLDFNAVSAVYGLMPVTLEVTSAGNNKYKLIEYYGKGDATARYGALIAENAASVLNGATTASYDAATEMLTITASQSSSTPISLKAASVLAANGIYGIEPYLA